MVADKRYYQEYYLKNKERFREYHQKNREHRLIVMKTYYQANKSVFSERMKQYRIGHKDELSEKNKVYRLRTADERHRKSREYRRTHRYYLDYFKNRMKTDEKYRLKCNLRRRLLNAMKRKCRKPTSARLGIDFNKIVEHLGPKPNDGRLYHIDHIRPLASFDLGDPSQVRLAFAPENHQWLTKGENLRKHAKVST